MLTVPAFTVYNGRTCSETYGQTKHSIETTTLIRILTYPTIKVKANGSVSVVEGEGGGRRWEDQVSEVGEQVDGYTLHSFSTYVQDERRVWGSPKTVLGGGGGGCFGGVVGGGGGCAWTPR